MSLTNSLKKVFFLTNMNKNQPKEISKINISLSKNKNKRINKSYNNSKIFSIYDKRHYKLNNDLNIYPSPERIKKNNFDPIIFKTGILNQNNSMINNKKINGQFYVPIMKKAKRMDPFQSLLLEDISNTSKSRDLNFKLKNIKTEEKTNKDNNKNISDENKKNKKNGGGGKNNGKNKKNEMSTIISYSLDKYGKPKLKRSCFNLDVYKDNVETKIIEDFWRKNNGKRRNHKEQIIMRNKFQHVNNYNKRLFLKSDDSDNIFSNETKTFIVDFQPETNQLTENNSIYINKDVYAKDLVKEKLPNFKVTGFEQLYMNSLTSVRPNK